MEHSITPLVNLTLSLDGSVKVSRGFPTALHSPVNFCSLIILSTMELNDSSLVHFGCILCPKQLRLTMPHCSHLLWRVYSVAQFVIELLACRAHGHMVICDLLYLLAVLQTFYRNNPHIHDTNFISQFGIHNCSTTLHITLHHPAVNSSKFIQTC
jgi:hypothetical protein